MADIGSVRGVRRPTTKPTRARPRALPMARAQARTARPAPPNRELSDRELTADVVFRVPTIQEVVAAGYPAERLDSIRREQQDYRKRFVADPEFRANTIAAYRRHQAELERERNGDRGQ